MQWYHISISAKKNTVLLHIRLTRKCDNVGDTRINGPQLISNTLYHVKPSVVSLIVCEGKANLTNLFPVRLVFKSDYRSLIGRFEVDTWGYRVPIPQWR